ncbi:MULTISPECIES: spore coat protein [Bacillaceae]|uniref:spore coat protein n=1 Tax=Bacillaceae TaxID=186817 RepID=UPI002FFD8639
MIIIQEGIKMTGLAPHETMETHEMINFKTVCLLKSKLMMGICFDNELKSLMEKDVLQSKRDLNELIQFYKQSQLLQ